MTRSPARRAAAALLFAVAAASLTASLHAEPPVATTSHTGDRLADAFANPPKTVRPDVRWWWPGDAVDDAELEREIALLDKAGFGGAEIQSFNPGIPDVTPEERPAVTGGYAEPPFFGHVRTAARAAGERGLRLDYTFGSAWPSGGGFAITPDKALLELAMAITPVHGDGKQAIKVEIPARTKRLGAFNGFDAWTRSAEGQAWRDRFEARGRIVSVMAVQGGAPLLKPKPKSPIELSRWNNVERPGTIDPATRIDLTGRLAADGTLDWSPPPGDWLVFVFKQYAVNSGVLGASGTGPQLVLNHFDKGALDAHAARVGDPLIKALDGEAGGLRATFIDSLELFQDLPWDETFLAEFKARRGYDLVPYLPFIVQPGWMEAWAARYSPPYFEAANDAHFADRVRADYHQTVSDLMLGNFLRPWIDWNHGHGLKAKFQAHGGPIDILQGYGLADIPETEDLHGGGDPHFLRLARSAADVYGRPLVSAEALVWKDRPYSVTPEEMRQRIDRLFASGVNAQTIHGSSYRFHAGKWPGWFAFQPSGFATGFSSMLQESNPVWAGVPQLTAYIARTNAVLRQGRNIVPVALLHEPIGYFEGMDGDRAGEERRLGALLAGGFDYDRINPDGLSQSRVEGNALVTPGGHRFAALVLPAVDSLRAETAEAIAAFAEQSLPVFFTGRPPARETGLADFRARDRRVQAAMARVAKAGGKSVADLDLPTALRMAGIPDNLRFTGDAEGLIFIERAVGARRLYFIHNGSERERDASFVTATIGSAERWDAMTGTRAPVGAAAMDGGLLVSLPLAAGASALIVIDPDRGPQAVADRPELSSFELPAAGWRLSVEGHGPGGIAVARDMGVVALGDWSSVLGLEHFAGAARYQTRFRLPKDWTKVGREVRLTLRGVHDMATVTVNGHSFAPMISRPWTIDISSAVRPGTNRLEIDIANVPQNAMIDARKPGFKDLKPVPAGLHGPALLQLFAKAEKDEK